tara:strand:+ start:41 stop:499 length:459 start_codon:yes stop_codon:yes gene_type:complete
MAKQTMTLMFNAKTGILLGEKPVESADLDLSKFKFKTLEIDPIEDFYDGDYDTGSVKSCAEKPMLNESVVNAQTTQTIETKYPLHKQLNVIMDMLNKSDIPNTSEFADMIQHINETVEGSKLKKKTYLESDAYHYETEEEAKEKERKAIDFD